MAEMFRKSLQSFRGRGVKGLGLCRIPIGHDLVADRQICQKRKRIVLRGQVMGGAGVRIVTHPQREGVPVDHIKDLFFVLAATDDQAKNTSMRFQPRQDGFALADCWRVEDDGIIPFYQRYFVQRRQRS